MAVLYISEYGEVGAANNRDITVGLEPALVQQHVAIGAGSVQSSAFNSGTKLIRVSTDAICSIKIGANPTAVATDQRMPANTTEYFGVIPGQKIAVITNT